MESLEGGWRLGWLDLDLVVVVEVELEEVFRWLLIIIILEEMVREFVCFFVFLFFVFFCGYSFFMECFFFVNSFCCF